MSKFKIGDRVILKDHLASLNGREFRIDEVRNDEEYIAKDQDAYPCIYFNAEHIERPVAEPKPEKWNEFKMLEEIDTMLESLTKDERLRVIRYVMAKNGLDEGGF